MKCVEFGIFSFSQIVLLSSQVSFAQEIQLQLKLLRNLPLIFDGTHDRGCYQNSSCENVCES